MKKMGVQQQAIHSFIRSALESDELIEKCKLTGCPVVTISRDYGAAGRDVGRLLSDQLGVQYFNTKLLDGIIDKTKSDKHLLRRLDERTATFLDGWIFTFLSKTPVDKNDYFHALVDVLNTISRTGGVIIGRGAHLILSKRENPVFRVKIEGSKSNCASRVAMRNGIDLKAAMKRMKKINKERIEFTKDLYNKFPVNDRTYYDMVICSDNLSVEQIVDIINYTMKLSGYNVPDPVMPD
jgi:hypothetical protein